MRLLLDTHVAVWAVMGDPMLSVATNRMIEDPDNEVFVSIVCAWEIAIKNNLPRKRGVGLSVGAALREFEMAEFVLMGIEADHTLLIETLPHHHRDPFDRMLLVQALAEDCILVTHDDKLAAYGKHVLLV